MEKKIKCFDLIKKLYRYILEENKQSDFVLLYDGFGVVEVDNDLFMDLITIIYKEIYSIDGDINLNIVDMENWDDILLSELSQQMRENATIVQVNNNLQIVFIEYDE
jgi:hypothetical protein